MALQLGDRAIESAKAFSSLHVLKEDARNALASADDLQLSYLPAQLMEAGKVDEAATILPYLLPIRQAVWWGCLCAWNSCQTQSDGLWTAALEASVHWVMWPSVPQVERARKVVGHLEGDDPAGMCVRAVELIGPFFEGDAPSQDVDESSLPMTRPTQLVRAATTLLGAARLSIPWAHENQRPASKAQIVQIGLDVAEGRSPWVSSL